MSESPDFATTVVRTIVEVSAAVKHALANMSVENMQKAATSNYSALAAYLGNLAIDDDAKLALQVGVALGVVVLTLLLMFPGEPFDYTKLDGGAAEREESAERKRLESVSGVTKQISADKALDMEWPAEKIAAKTAKLQKLFGLTDEQMAQAISDAKAEFKGEKVAANDVNARAEGDSISLSQKVDFIVYATLIGLAIYFMRRDHGEGFSRFLMIYFPREAKALGLVQSEDEVSFRMSSSV